MIFVCLSEEVPCGVWHDLFARCEINEMRILFFAIKSCSDYCKYDTKEQALLLYITFRGDLSLRYAYLFCSY